MTQHEMNTERKLGHAQVRELPREHVQQDTPVNQVKMPPVEAAKQGTKPVARQTRKHGVKIASMNIKGKAMEGGKSIITQHSETTCKSVQCRRTKSNCTVRLGSHMTQKGNM